MSGATLIYAMPHDARPVPHVALALDALRDRVDRLVLVVPASQVGTAEAAFAGWRPTEVVALPPGPQSVSAAYRAGMMAVWQSPGATGPVILTGSHVVGPLVPLAAADLDPAARTPAAAMFSSVYLSATLDPRLKAWAQLDRVACLEFAAFSADCLRDRGFRTLWDAYRPKDDYWQDFLELEVKLAALLAEGGKAVAYPAGAEAFETADPRHQEIDRLVQGGLPFLPLSVLSLDPLLHDLYGINLRAALDALRAQNAPMYAALIDHVTRHVPMRNFAAAADQYEVVPAAARAPGKTEWGFGRVAVFIHAFYAEMMPEFWDLLSRLPCAYDLYLTTSTHAHKAQIEAYLAERGFPADRLEVRVVAQNRGRDMSSLFITFRDVVLSGRHEVALRLHSKRTPQVTRQVAEGFRRHLFDNLMASPGHVANILDMFEAQPDIGIVMPPVIHVGFATLGHSWFNNRGTVWELAKAMGVKVPLDTDTPVAPLGTMFWFRPAALRKMFAHDWRWEDYNPEPHHIDGGLAHVQERLIGYVAQGAGFRIVQVMTPELAGRYYAKLEYKLQLLAARLMSGNVLHQRDQLDHLGSQGRARLFRQLTQVYGGIIQRFPATRPLLHPVARLVVRVISPKP